jgi:hypothetical protein
MVNALYILTNAGGSYIPAALSNEARSAANNATWIEIILTNQGEVYKAGRVAFLIFDCSGFLDANFCGNGTRDYGVNPAEIQLSAIGDFKKPDDFITDRNTRVRYETLDDLNNNAKGIQAPVTNLFTFSYAIPGFWDEKAKTNRPQVNLAGTAADIGNRKTAIIDALTNYCEFTATQAGRIFTNLLDYIDPDLEPHNPSEAVEAVPMVNEIVVETRGGAPNMMQNDITVELWNPFDVDQNVNLTVYWEIGGRWETNSSSASVPANKYYVSSKMSRLDTSNENYQVQVYATITNNSVVEQVVDKTPNLFMQMQCAGTKSLQVKNPLYNFDSANWKEYPGSGTLETNNVNLASDPTWSPDVIPLCGGTNEGHLRSIGELGNIVYDRWQTIELYGTNRHSMVLSVFGFDENSTVSNVSKLASRFGLVNPNGANTNILNALVERMPINASTVVSVSNADTQTKIIEKILNKSGNFTNISDICGCWNKGDFPSYCTNELERKHVIGNLIGLLNTRQQVFMVFIEAQSSAAGKFFAQNPLYQRAIVVLWRDVFTGEYFVRYVKYLDE